MRSLRLVSAASLVFSCAVAPIVVSAATEPLSGVPMFPGTKLYAAPQTEQHCGITMRSVQYDVDNETSKPVDFFRNALPGATSWTFANGQVTAFLTSNGQSIVKVLNTSPNSYIIVYGSYSKPITVAQVRTGKC
jgi:hypothetical protein